MNNNDDSLTNKNYTHKNWGSGDFELAFLKYGPRLRLYAFRTIKDQDKAIDIVQDVFVKIWETREIIDSDEQLKSFLFRITRNDCLNYIKHKKVEQKYIDAILLSNNVQSLYMLSFLEDREMEQLQNKMLNELEEVIGTLPPQCRKVFELSKLNHLKNREISEKLSINIKTVEKHLSKAMKLIRLKMLKRPYSTYLLFFLAIC